MCRIFLRIAAVFWLLFHFELTLNAQLPELTSVTFADYRNAIEPTAKESSFLKVNWFAELGKAVQEANTREKPLLIYVMNGHPLACT
jgi:hypothetical protein